MSKVFLFVFIMALSQSLFSQGVRESDGDKALIFDMSTLDKSLLINYNFGLGYRHYLADNFSFSLSIGYNDTKRDYLKNDTATKTEINYIGVNPAIRYNISSNKNIIAFIGIDGSYMIENNVKDDTFNKNEVNKTIYSAGLFIGAEWFFIENLSLTAQYRLGYGVSSFDEKLDNKTIQTDDETKIQLGMSEFKISLSLFFN